MVIISDPHLAVLTTHACLLQGQWLWTSNLHLIDEWWRLLHNQISQWDFAQAYSAVTGKDTTQTGIMGFLQHCIGHSA